MARVQLGSIITDISGSIGGNSFSKDHYGLSIRRKPLPINPQSINQSVQRNRITNLQALWLALTIEDREKWNYFVYWSHQSLKNNHSKLLSGYNLFLKYQSARLMAGLSILSTFDFVPLTVIPDSFTLYNSGSTFYALMNDYVSSDQYFFNLFLSYPVNINTAYRSNGLRFMKVSYHTDRFYYLIDPYQAAFSILPVPGQQVNFRIYWFGITSPVLGFYQTGTKIIQAV